MNSGRIAWSLLLVTAVAVGIGYVIGCAISEENAAEAASPVEPLEDREVYYPGSEVLVPDEMRVTACGTGMPNAHPKQAAAC